MQSFRSPIRIILARLDGSESDGPVLDYAGQIAKRFAAHVKALHVRLEPASMPLLAGRDGDEHSGRFGRSPELLSERVASAAKNHFEDWRTSHSFQESEVPLGADQVSTEWQEFYGDEPAILAGSGRLADLVVCARPDPDHSGALVALEAAVFMTERPVLMTPPNVGADLFSNPVVGWNASPQATRALANALPFLQTSSGSVGVRTVAERNRLADASDVVAYLGWHGIEARIASPSNAEIGKQLQRLAHSVEGGLIVCGAYSRGRFRQILFGGVTSDLLREADLPVLWSC